MSRGRLVWVDLKADELLYERKLIAAGGLAFAGLKRKSQFNLSVGPA